MDETAVPGGVPAETRANVEPAQGPAARSETGRAIPDLLFGTGGPDARLAMVPMGSKVILLVEDEPMVRKVVRIVLQARGYVVHEARNGQEGLAACEALPGTIDLLLTDVVMPQLGGCALAERALRLRPDLKVLFMSGATQGVVTEGLWRETAFLQKPFTAAGLAQKVRDILDRDCCAAAHA